MLLLYLAVRVYYNLNALTFQCSMSSISLDLLQTFFTQEVNNRMCMWRETIWECKHAFKVTVHFCVYTVYNKSILKRRFLWGGRFLFNMFLLFLDMYLSSVWLCKRLMECVFFQALGVYPLLLMQWERSGGAAGQAKAAVASRRVTDWTNSILSSNNTASVALGAGLAER